MSLRKNSGFTLIELLISSALISLVLVGGFYVMNSAQKFSSQLDSRSDLEIQLNALATSIFQTAVVAGNGTTTGCTIPAASTLECSIFPTPGGAVRKIRYTLNGNTLLYQEETAPNTWTIRSSYPNISQFTIDNTCTLVDSGTKFANTCATLPSPNRFFRFLIRSSLSKGEASLTGRANQDQRVTAQGAFFVRNPSPFGPAVSFIPGSPI